MAKSRKRGRQTTLSGVEIKLERAKAHAQELDTVFSRVFPTGTCETSVEVHDQGRRHVYRAVDPPPVDPKWGAIAGDAIHNLRTALDHLAHQLVFLTGGSPNTDTAFPIQERPARSRWRRRKLLPDINPGVTDQMRGLLKSIQPYERRDTFGRGLKALKDLDNIDKHRVLLSVATSSRRNSTTYDPGHPPPEPDITWTRKPLQHGKEIAILVYEVPLPEPDPNLVFHAQPTFGLGEPFAGEDIRAVIRDLLPEIVEEIIGKFRHLFPK